MTFCKSKFSKNHCLKLYLCKRKVFGDAFIQPRRFHYEERYLFLSCFLHNSNFLILVLLLILFYRVHKIDWIIQKSFIKCKKNISYNTISMTWGSDILKDNSSKFVAFYDQFSWPKSKFFMNWSVQVGVCSSVSIDWFINLTANCINIHFTSRHPPWCNGKIKKI